PTVIGTPPTTVINIPSGVSDHWQAAWTGIGSTLNVNATVNEPALGTFRQSSITNSVPNANTASLTISGPSFNAQMATTTVGSFSIKEYAALNLVSSAAYVEIKNMTTNKAGESLTITLTDSNGKTATYTNSDLGALTNATFDTTPMSGAGWAVQGGFLYTGVTGEVFAFAATGIGQDTIFGEIDGDPGPLPEPFSMAIWALTGIGGLGMVRVCRNRRETAAG
ncbi:MAG: hypothetical protein ABR915_25215, partial [Thermoguttaceae bacterium]